MNSLRLIAGTLGFPFDILSRSARSEAYPDETAELVRLWFKIDGFEARRAVLQHVRALAERG